MLLILILYRAAPLAAENTGFLIIRTESGQTKQIDGTIVELSSRTGAVIQTGNKEERIPVDRLVNFGTVLTDAHINGDQSMKAKNYPEAVRQFQTARAEETRMWVKRQITARIIQSLTAQGEFEQACREFYLLAESDPETLYIACIPLPWFTVPEREQTAFVLGRQGIRQQDNPAMQLLAAGLLLMSPDRAEAVETLQKLAKSSNRPIAALATAQLWRLKLFDASKSDALTWEEQTELMDTPLQAGPHYLLGEVFARRQDPENAVSHWMKVILLHPEQRELVQQAAEHAAETLRTLGRPEQAEKLGRFAR
ncbi:MAG: hypothetical protein LBQ54_05715 [Planctomycetaceae bacterium]|nr:hypothetical protein [Planctomycetaceae bacterium]